jgi:hypothetical protein
VDGEGGRTVAMNRASFRRTLGERALRVPIGLHVLVLLVSAGVPLYQWVTFSGLFRLWAEAEARAGDSYNPKFIFVMLVCAFVFTGTVVTQVIGALLPPPSDHKLNARAAAFQRYEDAGTWMRRHSLRLKIAAVAIGLAAAGVHALLTRN